MDLLELFLSFLKVGAISFGGGMSMIPLILEEVLSHGWMTEERFIDLIAVAESTPGPIAVNIATFVGSSQAGFFGALIATIGVVTPSFIIILLIAAIFRTMIKKPFVQAALEGVRPAVVGMIFAMGVTTAFSIVFDFDAVGDAFRPDLRALFILVILFAIHFIAPKLKIKHLSPIVMILIAAGLGILFYGVF